MARRCETTRPELNSGIVALQLTLLPHILHCYCNGRAARKNLHSLEEVEKTMRKVAGLKKEPFKARINMWQQAFKDMPNMMIEPSVTSIGLQIIHSHFWLLLTFLVAGK